MIHNHVQLESDPSVINNKQNFLRSIGSTISNASALTLKTVDVKNLATFCFKGHEGYAENQMKMAICKLDQWSGK